MPKHDIALVKKYGKTFGYFDGRLPNLWTTDAELIRSVFVKDFDHFVNRRVSFSYINNIFCLNLTLFKNFLHILQKSQNLPLNTKFVRKFMTIMRGKEWKDVRSSVTPVFTTGNIKRVIYIFFNLIERQDQTVISLTDVKAHQRMRRSSGDQI